MVSVCRRGLRLGVLDSVAGSAALALIGFRLGPVGGAVASTTGLAAEICLRLDLVGGAVASTTGLAAEIGLRLSVLDSVAGSTALA